MASCAAVLREGSGSWLHGRDLQGAGPGALPEGRSGLLQSAGTQGRGLGTHQGPGSSPRQRVADSCLA